MAEKPSILDTARRLVTSYRVETVPCLNDACPDPGHHAHLTDSRDDLDAARWTGYEPLPDRAETLRTVALYGGTPAGCTLGDACDGCPQHDR